MKLIRALTLLLGLALGSLPLAVKGQFTFTTNNGAITITGYTGTNPVVTIPDTINGVPVTAIGDLAFHQNSTVISVTIGTYVTSIGDTAFDLCTNLSSVTIPNGVISIGPFAFDNCTSLPSVTIPDSVAIVGLQAFYYCTSLTNVTIGNSVTNIGDLGFDACSSLIELTIPGSVTSIGEAAFAGCSSLTQITVDATNPVYSSVDGVLLNKSQTTLIQCPGGKVGAYTLPNAVISIGDSAFESCSKLTRVTIPDAVTSIGYAALVDCFSLTNVTIGDGVTGIGDVAFANCSMLTGIYFSGNAPGLGGGSVFLYDTNATIFYLPGRTNWSSPFAGVPALLWNPQMPTDDGSFGVGPNGFGFNITGTTNIPIVVEASTNLRSASWTDLQTCTLTNGSIYFSDPAWTNYPSRFYRIRSP